MTNQAFSNLLVIGILLFLVVIIYCKTQQKTFLDVFKEIREMISPQEEYIN